MTEPQSPPDQEPPELSYEQARDELITVVNRLESGTENLEESMQLFDQGQRLATLCETYLTDARAVIDAHQEKQAN
ncbi:MAG: exodeoxyribonuclease VII small subunit [Propionibacteriaceae bacterium]|jgi:exodeoxyribonuclease VII small subunit|nr:exodeoxyribonuclease VII small subunit [Propionibacteriaceae bacterium]